MSFLNNISIIFIIVLPLIFSYLYAIICINYVTITIHIHDIFFLITNNNRNNHVVDINVTWPFSQFRSNKKNFYKILD